VARISIWKTNGDKAPDAKFIEIEMVLDTTTTTIGHGILKRSEEWGKGYKAMNLTVSKNTRNHAQKAWDDEGEDDHCE
jgi:hypothetical protein